MSDDLDLRGSIEQAMDADADKAPEQVVDTKVDTPDESQAISRESNASPAAKDAPDGSIRDGLGRFVKKAVDNAQAGASPGESPAQAVLPLQTPPEIAPAPVAEPPPPPVAWSPVVREHWAALPPAVQQEIARREQAFTQAFREVAPQREIAHRFQQAIQPHMMAIQAEGVDPITAVTNLMQIGSRLRFGTPAEKANTVAQIVKAYGVDIGGLDSALVGVAPQPGQNGIDPGMVQQLVQQQLQPIFQAAQQRQAEAAQQASTQTASEIEAFAADPKHEFFQDVRTAMADAIEMADRQGWKIDLKTAYDRACMLHPEVSQVIMARRSGVNAQAMTAAARKAKGAAVSVKGSAPVGNPEGREPSSVRDSIEAAIDAYSRI